MKKVDISKIKLSEVNCYSESLDHHGLVAGVCHDLGLVKTIDKILHPKGLASNRVVSPGESIVAMIINGLGFSNKRLYLTQQFFESKPVGLLLNNKDIKSSDITDDTLGKALDEVAEYGVDKLYGHICIKVATKYDLLNSLFHVDTTSISTTGEYADETQESEYVSINYGKSKDNKPNCKQVIMSLIVNGSNGIPLWMSPKNGNTSDKNSLYDTIKAVKDFCKAIDTNNERKWVADSALYNKNNLLADNSFLWLSRVPETIREAKDLIDEVKNDTWVKHDENYSSKMFNSSYGGVGQKWLLVYSEHAYNREYKTFMKNLDKQKVDLIKQLKHFNNEEFKCKSDLEKALNKLRKQFKYYTIHGKTVEIKKYLKAGKPKVGDFSKNMFRYEGKCSENLEAINFEINRKGKFILATNDLNGKYDNQTMLSDYKDQQHVESGFRFLKDPWFLVDSIFLKSNKRITALMMVMALCLLIYTFAQYRLRQALIEHNETLPNQVNKQIQNPTMRWIFQLMDGIHIVYLYLKSNLVIQSTVANPNEVRQKIILLFGGYALKVYGL